MDRLRQLYDSVMPDNQSEFVFFIFVTTLIYGSVYLVIREYRKRRNMSSGSAIHRISLVVSAAGFMFSVCLVLLGGVNNPAILKETLTEPIGRFVLMMYSFVVLGTTLLALVHGYGTVFGAKATERTRKPLSKGELATTIGLLTAVVGLLTVLVKFVIT